MTLDNQYITSIETQAITPQRDYLGNPYGFRIESLVKSVIRFDDLLCSVLEKHIAVYRELPLVSENLHSESTETIYANWIDGEPFILSESYRHV